MRILRSCSILFLLFWVSPLSGQSKTDSPEFNKLVEEYISGYLAARPHEAVSLGFHEYDGKLADYSRAGIDAEIARLNDFKKRFQKVDVTKISLRDFHDLRLIRTAIDSQLFAIVDLKTFERNPMTYINALDVNIYLKRNFAPLEDRVRNIIAIENRVQTLVAAAKANLAPDLPRPYVELGIEVTKGGVDFLRKNLPEALGNLKDKKLRAELQKSNQTAIGALQDYATWLTKQKLPKSVPDFAIGPEKYKEFLSTTELVELTPEQLLKIGMTELKRQQDAFATAAAVIDPDKPPVEVFKRIQKDHPTATNLIPDVAKNLEAIRRYLVDHHIITLPSEVRPKVEETPQYQRATSFASMDTPGPFEKKATEAYYYITPVEKEWPEAQKEEWLTSFNYYTSDVLSIHEAYPGHYVQFQRLNASPANKAEKIFSSYGFVEGWAHYAEQMMLDEGFGSCNCQEPTNEQKIQAAKYRMAQADEAMLRACRLVASIRMHTQGMSVNEATNFFKENCYYEEKPSRSEAMRGTFDPGYLNYTLGKLQILKLREDYKAQEGSNYSLQKFHDEITNHGMPPIRMLRKLILKDKREWGEVL